MEKIAIAAICLFFLVPFAAAGDDVKQTPSAHGNDYRKPSEKDKCQVCGMFVAKYPDWVAEIVFRDGTYAVFDGPKDMFKYYLDLARYDPSRKKTDITALSVTDYYDLRPIDGFKAYYIAGSDVYGPMGKELIPFEKKPAAEEFLKDHQGKRILTFQEVTQEVLKTLE